MAVACSSPVDDMPIWERTGIYPTPNEEAGLEANADREPFPLADGETPWEPFASAIFDGRDESAGVDKEHEIELMGWSVKGKIATRGGSQHYEPISLSLDNMTDFMADARSGHCGRFDGLVDNSWMPCIVPFARSGQKSWTWKYDYVSCGADSLFNGANAARKAQMYAAIKRAFVVAAHSGWIFTEANALPNSSVGIVIRCTTNAETTLMEGVNQAGAIGAGFPKGALTFAVAGTSGVLADTCEDPAGAESPGFPTGALFYHNSDEYWTYSHGDIALAWTDLWNYVKVQCAPWAVLGFEQTALMNITLHEIGHILGFTHQTDTNSDLNVMFANRSCTRLAYNTTKYRSRMEDALYDIDIPHPETALQIFDEDLSCYSPL